MATPAIINIDELLKPVTDDAPAGVNMRNDPAGTSVYLELKDARKRARDAERKADREGTNIVSSAPEWRTILELAPQALRQTSKDLEITCWYIEGLLREYGAAGLRDGFALARGLVEGYWDSFFSHEDEDGLSSRLMPLAGLNGSQSAEGVLIQPLRKILLTDVSSDGPFALYQYEQARALAKFEDAEVRARREAAGDISLERFQAVADASGGLFYISLLEDLDGAIAELKLLSQELLTRAKNDAPPTRAVEDLLGMIRDAVAEFSKTLVDLALVELQQREAANADESNSSGESAGARKSGGPVSGREDALRQLREVAEYFRKNEPHSPMATSLDEMVRRANLPFAELLAELVPDVAAWRGALTGAGIKPPPE